MYKIIVVHVDGSAATGISWTDYLILTGSMAAPIPPADFDGLRRTAALHLRAFADHAARLGIASVENRLVEDTADGARLLQARYADLVVLSRDLDPEPGITPRMRRLPEQVALRGVMPVFVVPPNYADQPVASTVLAGWDGSTQALRALAAALPLLQRAKGVRLVVVNPDRLSDLHGEQPGADMALYLATELHCDLLAMGCFGHSKLRELCLGGVSRGVLADAGIPVLLAH